MAFGVIHLPNQKEDFSEGKESDEGDVVESLSSNGCKHIRLASELRGVRRCNKINEIIQRALKEVEQLDERAREVKKSCGAARPARLGFAIEAMEGYRCTSAVVSG